MKKKTIVTLAAFAVTLGVTACGSQNDETEQLKELVAQLEQQVDDLQEEAAARDAQDASAPPAEEPQSTEAASSQEATPAPDNDMSSQETTPAQDASEQNTPSAPDTSGQEAAPTDSAQPKSAANTPNISVLSDLVQDLEQRIQDAAPSGSLQEQREEFYSLKGEIDAMEHELDYLEDELKAQRYSSNLDSSAYREQKQQVEMMEDRLDRCEDQLEFLFGIDD